MTSEGLHEPASAMSELVIDRHRAIISLMEELEAVDWYDQRVAATTDAGLADLLAHNRDEEKEHAAMTLEWLRRKDPVLDRNLRQYLFTEGPVTAVEEALMSGAAEPIEDGAPEGPLGDSSLGIGSLKWVAQ
jgi:ferritin-like protein